MTLSMVFAVIAVACSLAGLGCLAVGEWQVRRQTRQTRPARSGGRHRHPQDVRAARVRDSRGPVFPGPTRAQLRSEAATR